MFLEKSMSKLIKICKVTCIIFVFGLFAYLVFSIILNIKNPDRIGEVYILLGGTAYIYTFFHGLAEAAFFYLFIHFVEQWCIKNDIK
jgi:hypothetical protein